MKKEKIIDIIFVIFIIICIFIFSESQRHKESNVSWSLTENEQKFILENLNKKDVGNCILEPLKDGWKCTDKNGKIYIVRKSSIVTGKHLILYVFDFH